MSPIGRGIRRFSLTAAALACVVGGPARVSAQQAPPPSQQPAPPPPQAAEQAPPPPQRTVQRPAYLPNPANEDWSALKDPARRTDFWDPVKYIPIGGDDRFITLSGEVRLRPEGFRIKATDTTPSVRDNYLLQRYLFGTDVHVGPRVRVFAEFQSGVINGKIGATRPTDKDTIDLHQGFVELRSPKGQGRRFGLRIGRQELAIGSSRLISASPGLNTKRSFDGVRLAFGLGSWNFEGAAAALTALQPGAFDDDPLEKVKVWGIAAARPSQRWVKGVLGFYYLGLENRDAQYAQGRGRDLRQTFGMAWRGSGRQFDLNYDTILQTGSFEGSSVLAWGVSTDTGYRFSKVAWAPRVGLRFNSASGDRDAADPHLQSFNPLFPGASYAGIMGLFGPTNMTDLTPAITVAPRKNLIVGFERPLYWRTSTGDGIYNVDLRLVVPPKANIGHFVGASSGVFVIWQTTRHLQFSGAILRLIPGSLLKTTFVGSGAGLYSISTTYRF